MYPAVQRYVIGIKGVVIYNKNKLASRLKQHEHTGATGYRLVSTISWEVIWYQHWFSGSIYQGQSLDIF